MNFRIIILTAIMLPLCLQVSAQQPDRKEIRKGNRDFKKERYKEAEIDYRKALVKDSTSFAANYNLASVLYKNNDFDQAVRHLDTLSKTADVSEYASDYYYNRGNCAVQQKDWQKAVDSYKKSLIRNPDDVDAKENYIYAKEMLKQQQEQQQQQNDENQDNKDNQNKDNDKNKDDQNKDQNKNQDKDKNKDDQNKDNQNKDNQNKDNQNQNKSDKNKQSPKISPQAAQQMLKAIQAKEKETQEKVKKEKAAALESSQKEKNW